MNGLEVLRRLKGHSRFATIPVIVLTTPTEIKTLYESSLCRGRPGTLDLTLRMLAKNRSSSRY